MNVLVRVVIAIIISLVSLESEAQENYNIKIVVKDIESNDGKMFFALYSTDITFLDKAFKAVKTEIQNNQCNITFEDIPEGIYAVSIFHDENDNGKLDTNCLGIPMEDYGCSNNANGFMGPPKWGDAKFELKAHTSLTIKL